VTAQTYTVVKGDTLGAIAQRLLGDRHLFTAIFEANRAVLVDPNRIFPGQVLTIPAPTPR
jgi:nucleoid-associated protein YgaU